MSEKDIAEKLLADYNDVFADIVNVLLFDGKQIVNPDLLQSTKDKSFYKADGKLHEQERDISKILYNHEIKIAFIGFEHQSKPDKFMPLRVISYDGAAYRNQLTTSKGKSQIHPVVTLVLYFGDKKWKYGTSLYDVVNVSDEWKPFVSNYKINLFEIAFLDMETVNQFTSDFKEVAKHFVKSRTEKDYKPSTENIIHVDEFLKLMSVLTNDSRFLDVREELHNKEGGVSMCDVLDKVEARGVARGETKGKIEALTTSVKSLMEKQKVSISEAFDILSVSKEDRVVIKNNL